MKIREDILIPVRPADIWEAIADPSLWPLWNPKVKSIDRRQVGPMIAGEHFKAVFVLSGRESNTDVEVLLNEPPHRVTFRQHYEFGRRMRSVTLTFELQTRPTGIRFLQTTDLAAAGIPWFFRVLIFFVTRFGRSMGQCQFEKLKELVVARSASA